MLATTTLMLAIASNSSLIPYDYPQVKDLRNVKVTDSEGNIKRPSLDGLYVLERDDIVQNTGKVEIGFDLSPSERILLYVNGKVQYLGESETEERLFLLNGKMKYNSGRTPCAMLEAPSRYRRVVKSKTRSLGTRGTEFTFQVVPTDDGNLINRVVLFFGRIESVEIGSGKGKQLEQCSLSSTAPPVYDELVDKVSSKSL